MDKYDVIILGTGPAGLQAAIHAARKKIGVLVLGRPKSSSLYRAHIENYCCISGLKTGEELLSTGRQQAEGFGARFLQEDVIAIAAPSDGTYEVTTESEQSYFAYSLIIATGVTRHGLGLKGEKDLIGKGVSYCVDCDANFYHGARVAVVGDGSAAAYGAVTLSKIARQVTLITRDLKVSPALESALNRENISILRESTVRELKGTDRLEGVVLRDGTDLQLDGLFVEGGAKGAMELVASLGVRLDPEKFTYILTDKKQATNVPGIYAAGDICGRPFQMAKAVGEGCIAGLSASSFALKKKSEMAK